MTPDNPAAEVTPEGCTICANHARVEALIEASSLGSAEAKAARESVPHEVGIAIASAAKYLARAEAAEQRLAAVRAVHARYFDLGCDPFDASPEPEDVWRYDRDLRAALGDADGGGDR